ncbi:MULTISPECIES: alpha-L-fucosidase [Petrimonas]|jgi:alpha-L-fucosidase|uniref:alpha-L-fucosidase n=2 Tax=Petrimonas mucosa TaxID=1642646 RepID=A0A1G4GB85_9BACT|nr:MULTISPECIES: alpha-L-fucosidase [Petrimonas]MDD3561524.1 alpha-L-fucosidase [Petrimonas mucosa]SCM59765.1 Alpha-L-fucosidase 1 [Petrimonas mucosa]SFU42304.1 alpha-L-fucosidase [Porphyromonadaceae bacterium KHP3R9]HHT30430.1 alpha-L-fucosidase [Petrimonas mucosa]
MRLFSTKGIISFCFIASIVVSCKTEVNVAPPEPVYPVPSDNQLAWHEMEMNAFIHFTTNTFTDLEWGYGDEKESIFNPTALDVDQWVTNIKETGFKGIILTCKHHDGFCLWPSQFTEHSIKKSPYKNGQGDIVKELSDACKRDGLKFGVYLSPWDRNHKDYGNPDYILYYRNQIKELFTNYGDIFEMWFDGANGGTGYYGGARESRSIDRETYYDWPTTLRQIRELQPNVLFFSDAGPDIRWVGNERGFVNETNWNTITPDTLYAGKSGINKLLNTGSIDGTKWIPAEVDVSIRPGWFYHEKEDSMVKTPEELFEIYLTSVGRGSLLLLNIPPDKRGLIHENDIKSLKGFRKILDETFANNLAAGSKIMASNYRGKSEKYAATNLIDNKKDSHWATDDDTIAANLEISLKKPQLVSYILLQEQIKLGQRVKSFSVETWDGKKWVAAATGTTIGYKRILKIDPVTTSKIRVNILEAKASPVLNNIELY